jgi:hypothetical protein
MLIENYDFLRAQKRSGILLAILLPILLVAFLLGFSTLVLLNQPSLTAKWSPAMRKTLFWVLFVLLILPFFWNQCAALILSALVILFLLLPGASTPTPTTSTFTSTSLYRGVTLTWILVILTILYAVSMYFILMLALYMYGTSTPYDLSHPLIYTQTFIDLEDIHLPTAPKNNMSRFHQEQVEPGKKKAASSRIVFGVLARDVAPTVEGMKKKIEGLGDLFQDYRVVIFENDSKDGTRDLLQAWHRDNPRVQILSCCEEGQCECRLSVQHLHQMGMESSQRMDKLRHFRQKVLRYVQQHYADYDYYLVIDFDLPGAVYRDGFLSTFARDDFDMVFARGLTTFPMFSPALYDGIAYLSDKDSFDDPSNDLETFLRINRNLRFLRIGDPWAPARSGFNGMAIYRMKSILHATYTLPGGKKHRCEHIDLHYDMYQKGFGRIYYNPSMILFAGHQGKERKDTTWKEYKKYVSGLWTAVVGTSSTTSSTSTHIC